MKVLFISRRYPPSVGGMQNFAYDLHAAISVEVNVGLIKWGGSNSWLPFIVPYFFLRACYEIIRFKPDVIHLQDALLSPLGFVLGKLFNRPYTVVVHGLDITYTNFLYQAIIPKTVSLADKVFCISKAAADEAASRGVSERIIEVIPLGAADTAAPNKDRCKEVLVSRYPELENKRILLTVGRLAKRKGVEWFIRNVLPGLVEEFSSLTYCVAGTGEERDNIRVAVSDMELEDDVKLLGRVDDETLAVLYGAADLFIMPNIPVENDIEGFGIVLIEAALNELPIVAAGIEGILDATKNNESAKHVQPSDTEGFLEETGKLLKQPDEAREFGRKARRYTVSNYSWSTVASKYIDGYRDITR